MVEGRRACDRRVAALPHCAVPARGSSPLPRDPFDMTDRLASSTLNELTVGAAAAAAAAARPVGAARRCAAALAGWDATEGAGEVVP